MRAKKGPTKEEEIAAAEKIVSGIIQKMREEMMAERDALVKMLCNCFPSFAGYESPP